MTEIAEIVLEPLPDPFWRVLKQIGVDSVVGVLPRGMSDWRAAAGELPWEYGPLALYKHRLEEAGFSLAVIEDNPPMDALRLGTPNREEELEQFCTLVRSMGRLGIPVLCFHWMPVFGWLRTSVATVGRGGAYVTAYDHSVLAEAPETHAGVVTEDRLWANLRWFLERVLPVAEESGVKLALHPDDPPVTLGPRHCSDHEQPGSVRADARPRPERVDRHHPLSGELRLNDGRPSRGHPPVWRAQQDLLRSFPRRNGHARELRRDVPRRRQDRYVGLRSGVPRRQTTTASYAQTTFRRSKAIQQRFPATRTRRGCLRSATSRVCSKRSLPNSHRRRRCATNGGHVTDQLRFVQVGTGGMGKYWCSDVFPHLERVGKGTVVAAVDIVPEHLANARELLGLDADRCYTGPRPCARRARG